MKAHERKLPERENTFKKASLINVEYSFRFTGNGFILNDVLRIRFFMIFLFRTKMQRDDSLGIFQLLLL